MAKRQENTLPTEHPGQMLKSKMADKDWTMEELEDVTATSRQNLSLIMSGKRSVTPDMAVRFAAAFGNTPADWLRWQTEHQLSLVETDAESVANRSRLYTLAPVREMQKRGWIKPTKTDADLESELQLFFGKSLSDGIAFPVATLRSDPLEDLSPTEKAWCFRARQLAEASVFTSHFEPNRIIAAEKKLRQLAAYPKEIERLNEMLAYFGIRFVVVEPLPGSRIDGAAFWIGESPAIAISLRWDRIDAFWFTLMHEFMHIKNGDAYSFDVNLVTEGDHGIAITVSENAAEQRANEQAAEALVPQGELDSFIGRTAPLYASERIIQFAHRIKMHPGIIVGQLQHRRELRYSSHRDFLVKIRKYVTETALTDGFGRTFAPNVV